MPAITATAPGKIILFGEHAVVYGRPAIAAPVDQVRARAIVTAEPRRMRGEVRIQAPDMDLEAYLDELEETNPLGLAVRLVLNELGVEQPPACTLRITSSIPVASGLGSGAAVSVALIRAFSEYMGRPLPVETVSALAYEVEKLHHGTPSGIDNTVISYGLPVYFVRNQPIQLLRVPVSFTIVIGDTGVQSPTAVAVADLRRAWQADARRYEPLFDDAAAIAMQARELIETGRPQALGPLMDENQDLLGAMGVSSPELEHLVAAARAAGVLGAKLSGAGRGGNMIALVDPENASQVVQALRSAGAARTVTAVIRASG